MRQLVNVAVGCVVLVVSARAQVALFDRSGDVAWDWFGAEVAFVGDVDADGEADFAVGAPSTGFSSTNPGFVRVFSGRSLQILATWSGSGSKDRYGLSIAGAGDIDGDGNDDVLIGSPQKHQSNPGGYAVVRSGATGLALHTFTGTAGMHFGHAVAGRGFIDADAVPDLLIGAPYAAGGGSSRGRVFVYSGATGALIRSHDGPVDWGTFGWSVAFLGDLDGDGRDEYTAGAPAAWNNSVTPRVRAFDGATGATLWTSSAASLSDALGWSLAPIGDLSGDGVPDLLIGAMQDAGVGCGPCTGKGYVRAVNGLTGAQLYQVNNTAGLYVGFGWDVAAVGDVNANGFEDFASSRPGTEGCGGGLILPVQVRDGQFGDLLLEIPVILGGNQFGLALASGDANADGLRDLICGAPCTAVNAVDNVGTAYVYTIVRAPAVYCESETNSLGCTPAISASGTASATLGSPFDIGATAVINNKSGLLFYSFKPRQTPFQGGHMCVVAPTKRTGVQSSGGNPPPNDCSGAFTLDFNARIQSGVDPQLVAGEEVFAQYWSRDPADGSTTNLTDALAFWIAP